jgi:uncharacterized integral membrane protein (TIGR00697 family)
LNNKSNLLFIILSAFFITNALLAEIIGSKIFSLEQTLHIQPFDFSFFGINHLSFNLTAGVILWPIVFVMTDIINEYFGRKGVQMLSILTAILISYAFLMILIAMHLYPADFWIETKKNIGIQDMNASFNAILGQGLWIIIGSLVAFLIGQMLDVYIFHIVKRFSGKKFFWVRSLISTLFSQLIDSFVVLFIAFYIGNNWSLSLVFAIGIMNYIYKFLLAIFTLPLIFIIHSAIEKYLGKTEAEDLKNKASLN